eukprot:7220592-Pyramimonas_sp.AAC.2
MPLFPEAQQLGVRVIEAKLISKDLSNWQKLVRCELLVTDSYDDKLKVSSKVKGHTGALNSDKTKSVSPSALHILIRMPVIHERATHGPENTPEKDT